MNQDFPEDEVLVEIRGGLGVITLNRPDVLNALSLDMIRSIAAALHRWEGDDSVRAVLFQAAGGRAFCAGGDVRSFYNAGMDCRRGRVSPRVPVVFFAEEYSLNKQIFHYPKPSVAVMDGITMGGGYGIAGHCDVRIAGPKSVLAMPEVRIGFFPDVGSLYQLHRCGHHYGRYLALSGQDIDGETAVSVGLADLYVEDSGAVVEAVAGVVGAEDFKAAVAAVLGGGAACGVPEHADVVEAVFCDFDMGAIIERLEREGSGFAKSTLEALRSRSPVSLAVTARRLQETQGQDFDDVIAGDFVLVQHFIRQGDMYEGIRAQIIDKDKNPEWSPKRLEDIREEDVNLYFTPTGYDLKDVRIF
ncbi:MAG: 3-hydroxyisobutyryl-CoA hydrolase [Alphaproteobacteria bacterium]